MQEQKKKILLTVLALALLLGAVAAHYAFEPFGFYRATEPAEAALRLKTVAVAQSHLGKNEADGSHQAIIDLYNSHEPLAVDYVMSYTDSWCAAFVSAVAIEEGLTDIIPTECGCERQIELWKSLGRWQERDSYIPEPGDLIYYDWDQETKGECTGWSDHVGMVVGIKWPYIRVIEGNCADMVMCRTILADDILIRGFGLPDYAGKVR